MAREEIKNKIISVETIMKIANLLENEKLHYQKLGLYNQKFNYYNKNEISVYEVNSDKVKYNIKLKSGESVEKEDLEWFKNQLTERYLSAIDSITIWFDLNLWSERTNNKEVNYSKKYKSIDVSVRLYENEASFSVDASELEDEAYKLHSDIVNILNSCPDRYNKTIKHRFIRTQCLALTIGFVISYIAIFILKMSYNNLPEVVQKVFDSTIYSYVICFFIIAFGVGNIIGQGIMAGLYRVIAPKKKYSHYDVNSKKSVYVDNITEYMEHDEVQIGKYCNSIARRAKIEKIFKVTGIIVTIQIFITIVYCLIIRM
ncbi:MAG: hypothetical protein IJH12_10270 [Clostridia bacterium]|nr:hypothetical protein [Clostridia bacterium]